MIAPMTVRKFLLATVALALAAAMPLGLGGCGLKTTAEIQVLDSVKRTPVGGADVSIAYLGWAMVEGKEPPQPTAGVTNPSGMITLQVKPVFGRPANLTVDKVGYVRKVMEVRSWANRVTVDLVSKDKAKEEKAVKAEKAEQALEEGSAKDKKKKSY